jgi:hypothetical protein
VNRTRDSQCLVRPRLPVTIKNSSMGADGQTVARCLFSMSKQQAMRAKQCVTNKAQDNGGNSEEE